MIRVKQQGYSLAETLVAAALTTVIVAVAFSLMASVKRVDADAVPMTDRLWDRARAAAEIQSAIADAAAERAYFDLHSTIEALHAPSPAKTDKAGGKGGDGNDDGGPKGGGDGDGDGGPKGGGSGGGGGGGGGGGAPTAGQTTVRPVVAFGTGVRVGESLSIPGLVTVTAEDSGLFADQVGDAVSLLRTKAPAAPLRLGTAFDSSSGVIRLVASSPASASAIADLRAGDVLVITGRAADGSVVTALTSVTKGSEPIAAPTPQTIDGDPIFAYHELQVTGPGETLRGGLRNSPETTAGVVIATDATIALVDPDDSVVTYYTAAAATGGGTGRGGGPIALHKVVGDPARPLDDTVLVGHAAAPLDARLFWDDGTVTESSDGGGKGEVKDATTAILTRVTISVPVLVEAPRDASSTSRASEMLEIDSEIVNVGGSTAPMPIWFGVFAAPGGGHTA